MATLAQLVVKLTGDIGDFRNKVEESQSLASKMASGIGRNVQNLGKVALGGLGAVAAGAGAAGVALGKMAVDAAAIEGVRDAFVGLAESSGQSADELLAALERGSSGMVAQRDLMKSYNQAAQLVSTTFANQLPEAMGYLSKVSAATGQDMGYLLDSLVRGVGRLSPMILDNLAIQVDMTEAAEKWAATSGLATTKVIDNAEAIKKQQDTLAGLENQLAVTLQRQSEFTDKTAESTKMATQFRIEELTSKIADHRGELDQLVASHGKTITSTEDLIDNMSKAQQQEALMAQVMEKLAANTAAMPDVTGKAATGMAQMRSKMQNVKDQVGTALLPVLNTLLGTFGRLVDKILPPVVNFIETKVGPAFEGVAQFLDKLFVQLGQTEGVWEAITMAFEGTPFEDLQAGFIVVRDAIQNIIDTVTPYVEMAVEWIAQHVELKDVLIAVGIAIASVVIPAILSILAAVVPIIAVFAGLVAAVALLRTAWENDWGGIRTALTDFWENTGRPALEQLWTWLQVNIPLAIETAKTFWEGTLKPALETVWTFIQESVIPAIGDLVDWLQVNIPLAIETAKTFWEGSLKPALETVWTFIQESVIPIFETVVEWLATNIPVALEALSDLWENTLKPALELVWSFAQENLVPLFEAIVELFNVGLTLALAALAGLWENVLKPALETVWNFIKDNLQPVFDTLKEFLDDKLKTAIEGATPLLDAIKAGLEGIEKAIKPVIDFIKDLTEKIKNIKLPDWLTPGSPTPLETGLLGIADALREVESLSGRAFATPQWAPVGVHSVSAAATGGGGRPVMIYGDIHVHGVQDGESLLGRLQELAE